MAEDFIYYLDLIQVPKDDGRGTQIISVPVEKKEFDQLKAQIKQGKTKFVTEKPSGLPQVWILEPNFVSASVRMEEKPKHVIVPDGKGAFGKAGSGLTVPGSKAVQ